MNLSGIKRIRPLGRRILMQRCRQAEEEIVGGHKFFKLKTGKCAGLAVPESYADQCNMNEIVDLADDCKMFDRSCIGKFVQAPEWSKGLACISREHELWMAHEDIIPAIVYES